MQKLIVLLILTSNLSIFSQIIDQSLILGHFGEGIPRAVYLDNNIAYLCTGTVLKLIDYSDPLNLKTIGKLDLQMPLRDIFVENNRIYLLADKLVILDCTNPAELNVLSSFNITGAIFKVIHNIILFAESYTLTAVRITNDFKIEILDTIDLFYEKYDLEYDGKFTYVCSAGAIYKIDTEDFSDMKLTYSLESNSSFRSIAICDNYLYASSDDKFITYNKDSLNVIQENKIFNALGKIFLRENKAYVSSMDNGLYIFDISNPANPGYLGSYSSWVITDIFIDDKHTGWIFHDFHYSAGPIEILNVSTVSPQLITKIDVPGSAEYVDQIKIYGNYVIGRNWWAKKVIILDCSNQNEPQYITQIDAENMIQDINIRDHFLYLSTWDGIEIYDINDCSHPVLTSRFKTGTLCQDILFRDNYVYVYHKKGFFVIDISDQNNPALVGTYGTSEASPGKVLNGDYAYLNVKSSNYTLSQIQIINMKDPLNPFLEETYSCPEGFNLYTMQLSFPYLYLYGSSSGETLMIYDVTNPLDFKLVRTYASGYSSVPQDVIVKNNRVYCRNLQGFYILDVTDFDNIYSVGRLMPSLISCIQVENEMVYLCTENYGIYLLNNEKIVSVQNRHNVLSSYNLYPNYPNPFNNTTLIKYNVETGGQVLVRVYNTLGQLISTPINEYQSAGEHSIKFDASEYPSGVYIYNFSSGDVNISRKMILLK